MKINVKMKNFLKKEAKKKAEKRFDDIAGAFSKRIKNKEVFIKGPKLKSARKATKKTAKKITDTAKEKVSKEVKDASAKRVSAFDEFRVGKGTLKESRLAARAKTNNENVKSFVSDNMSKDSSFYSKASKAVKDGNKTKIDDIMKKDHDGYIKDMMPKNSKLSDYSIDKQNEFISKAKKQRTQNPTIIDNARYRKIPEATVGLGSVAFLTSRLSETKGKLSNAQLFGKKPI